MEEQKDISQSTEPQMPPAQPTTLPLATNNPVTTPPQQPQPSGLVGPNGPLPKELQGWNWGAFFLSWIWSIANQSYLGLLALISPIQPIMIIILGIKGNEWAWQNRKFESVEQFKAVQKAWTLWGLGLFIFSFIASIGILVSVVLINVSTARDKAREASGKASEIASFAPDATLLDKTATNADLGFNFVIPKGWEENNDLSTNTDLISRATTPDTEGELSFYPNINVVHEEIADVSLDDYVVASKKSLTSSLNDYSLVSSNKVTVSGKDAELLCATFTQGLYKIKDYALIIFNNTNTVAYVVTGSSLASTWDKNDVAIKSSILTFTTTK